MGSPGNQLITHETEGLTASIVSAVSEAKGVDPLSPPPLGGTVDIGALQTFVDGVDDSMSLSFTYHRLRVSVRDDGSVAVGRHSNGE